MLAAFALFKRPTINFFGTGNGQQTPEIESLLSFYTTSAESCPITSVHI
jgi:hypothetical protein